MLACRINKVSVSRPCPIGQQAAILGQQVSGSQLLVHSFLVLACRINKVSVSRSLAPRPSFSRDSLQNKKGFSKSFSCWAGDHSQLLVHSFLMLAPVSQQNKIRFL
jgi:hypothetical protein